MKHVDEPVDAFGRLNGLRQFWLWNSVFLVSGVTQNLMAYQFDVIGFGANSLNLLNAAGNPLGQLILSSLQPSLWRGARESSWSSWLPLFGIAGSEIAGNVFAVTSIARIGSGLHQIIYSTIVVSNALLGHCVFRKRLSRVRWVALLVITVSVAVASMGQPTAAGGGDWYDQFFGVAFGIGATVSFSLTYVMGNHILSSDGPECASGGPLVVALRLGMLEVSVMAVYFFAYVVPRWHELVVAPMGDAPPPSSQCVGWYIAYLAVCGLHQYGFYYCVSFGELAAVTSGVNKSLQTVVMFFSSSALFCSVTPKQCITAHKVVGTIGVCAGVLLYALEDMAGFGRKPSDQEMANKPRVPDAEMIPVIGASEND